VSQDEFDNEPLPVFIGADSNIVIEVEVDAARVSAKQVAAIEADLAGVQALSHHDRRAVVEAQRGDGTVVVSLQCWERSKARAWLGEVCDTLRWVELRRIAV
jgi:hypothetical protein